LLFPFHRGRGKEIREEGRKRKGEIHRRIPVFSIATHHSLIRLNGKREKISQGRKEKRGRGSGRTQLFHYSPFSISLFLNDRGSSKREGEREKADGEKKKKRKGKGEGNPELLGRSPCCPQPFSLIPEYSGAREKKKKRKRTSNEGGGKKKKEKKGEGGRKILSNFFYYASPSIV